MSRPSARRTMVAALAAVALSAPLTFRPASADAPLVRLSVAYRGQQAVYVDACLTTTENLPARVVLRYTISAGPNVVPTQTWDGGSPETILVDTPTCPVTFTQFATTGLTPGRRYTVRVTATVTAMVEDESFELAPDPDGYPTFRTTTTLRVVTPRIDSDSDKSA